MKFVILIKTSINILLVKYLLRDLINYFFSLIYILYQQFITWSMRADCESYIVTLYIQTEVIWTGKEREEKIKKSQKKI